MVKLNRTKHRQKCAKRTVTLDVNSSIGHSHNSVNELFKRSTCKNM